MTSFLLNVGHLFSFPLTKVDPKYIAFIPPVAFPTEIKRSLVIKLDMDTKDVIILGGCFLWIDIPPCLYVVVEFFLISCVQCVCLVCYCCENLLSQQEPWKVKQQIFRFASSWSTWQKDGSCCFRGVNQKLLAAKSWTKLPLEAEMMKQYSILMKYNKNVPVVVLQLFFHERWQSLHARFNRRDLVSRCSSWRHCESSLSYGCSNVWKNWCQWMPWSGSDTAACRCWFEGLWRIRWIGLTEHCQLGISVRYIIL